MDFHLIESERKKSLQRFLRQDVTGPLIAPLTVLPCTLPRPLAMPISLLYWVGQACSPQHFCTSVRFPGYPSTAILRVYYLISSLELWLTFQLLIVNQTQPLTYYFSIALVTLNTPYSLIISFIVTSLPKGR